MKRLPPTLREKRRYILVRIIPGTISADERELYYAVADCITSLYGDTVAALMHAATIRREGDYLILRCRRGWETKLCSAVATVRMVTSTPVHLETCAISGTIKALRKQIRPQKKGDPFVCTINSEERDGIRYPDGKIDLIRRDMKGQEVVFLTQDDMEMFHATTTKSNGI
ncbi:MAG: ribonuclease P [Methanocalculus sp. MSAO_Arc2]|uniref:Rpp14/Pop5 family protein n=1 Tax=Methanocalculus sp. MSAO_Arc2 TaxID=2293855 RepID=UPI000FF40C8C|nr:MAG: ribonuclease P [Methanocalculus sp. MSAO_Arc2]